ncbi:MAG: alkaline phosphatase [Bacteroides sp.]|nr:alkaline phosphatase [Bacteroides sp.]
MKIKGTSIIGALLSAISIFSSCSNEESGQAKYIFVMIGDGMGASHVAAAESYMSYQAGKLGGEQLTFTKFPVYGTCTSYSANKNITCSSASGTAIATGHKTNNNMLGVDPDGKPLKSMAYTLKEQGYRIGITTSVPVNHATPAAFYANSTSRHDYYNIAMQIPESGFDFFAGSGLIDINGSDGQMEPMDEVLEKAGYDVCYGVSELKESTDDDGVVLLAPSQRKKALNYEVKYDEKDDTSAEVLQAAIDFLGDKNPFFIMYEGGEIDWAAHSNDLKSTIESVMKFDDAVKVAYEFYLKHPEETLIIVTADHETGGIALGADAHHYELRWENLSNQDKDGCNREVNIGWTSDTHTGGPVPVFAIGKGAERFGGRIDNTDIYGKIVLN